jgi:hypothetical protein
MFEEGGKDRELGRYEKIDRWYTIKNGCTNVEAA